MSNVSNIKLKQFVQIPVEAIRKSQIPLRSRMLLVYLLSYGDWSEVSCGSITSDLCLGTNQYYNVLEELVGTGILRRQDSINLIDRMVIAKRAILIHQHLNTEDK